MNAITIRNLDVVFGDNPQPALDLLDQGKSRQEINAATGTVVGVNNVSLDVEQGEICVLMGLSGSGKSSLLRAINGLNSVSRGSLLVQDGQESINLADCNQTTLRQLRMHKVSMVFQKFALMPWLTVLDNVAFGLEMQGVGKKQRRQQAREKLQMVDLQEWEDKYPHELSGGMQQRVGLARAFTMDSDILLMDEPFSALDPLIRSQLQDELLSLQKKLNKTIVFVSHDLDEALKIGTHIAIMESGELIQHGTPEEIVLTPTNQYVKDFVAHTNPLNVLKGRSLMKDTASFSQDQQRWQVCAQRDLWLEHKEQNWQLTDVNHTPQSLQLMTWQSGMPTTELNSTTLVMASPEISMRDAIEIRYKTGLPILLIDKQQLVGTLNDDDFYHALLGKYHQAA